jgi:tetratricopeptide (TPR) repeat protein
VLSNKRNRWLINLVMIVAVVSFSGIAVIAPFTEVFRDQTTDSAASPTSGATSQTKELQDQARGYELVLQREPDNQTALQGLVDTRIQIATLSGKTEDIKSVIAPLEKLAQLNPDESDYTVLLAQAKLQTGDREGAAQAYRGILSSNPGDLNALQGLTELMMQQQRPESAIGLLQDTLRTASQANQIKPKSVDETSVRLLLARVYAAQKRYAEALAIYDEAIENDKQDFRPLLGKAIVLQTQGKKEEAQPLFTSAAALAPAQFKDQINQIAAGSPTSTPSASMPSASTPTPSPTAENAEPNNSDGNADGDTSSSTENNAPAAPSTPQSSTTP